MSDEREQRNAVFSGTAMGGGVDPRIPQVSMADKVKAEFGLDIASETVPLPSGGKTYPADSPFHDCDTVDISPMTAREEDILTSKALLKKGTIITELIKSCLIEKGFDVRNLLTGDRNALMVAIRITGYGAEYDAEIECAECGAKTAHQFDLAALPINRLELEPCQACSNMFEFMLPYSKKNVKFRFLTGRDEEELMATIEKQKKLGLNSDTTVTTNLLYSIVSVDGIDDRAKISSFIKCMPARDSLALRNYMRTHEPGIVMKQETECPSCGARAEVTMPLGVSFLWPSSK